MEPWLELTAAEFWKTVGSKVPFPRNLEEVIPLGYPVCCTTLPQLSVGVVEAWLKARGAPYQFLCQDRSLSGCVVAARGKGILFHRSDDSEDETRFTMAHEFAHFLLDYVIPRRKALEVLGPAALEVLDGDRDPTVEERVSAALGSVSLGVYFNLMPRSTGGEIDQGYVMKAETRADRLALELLAPMRLIRPQIPRSDSLSLSDRRAAAVEVLVTAYGLPARISRLYSTWLVKPRSQSTAAWLGIGIRE